MEFEHVLKSGAHVIRSGAKAAISAEKEVEHTLEEDNGQDISAQVLRENEQILRETMHAAEKSADIVTSGWSRVVHWGQKDKEVDYLR